MNLKSSRSPPKRLTSKNLEDLKLYEDEFGHWASLRIFKAIQLLLYCAAVVSNDKEKYIKSILQLDNTTQAEIKKEIEEVIHIIEKESQSPTSSDGRGSQFPRVYEDSKMTSETKSQLNACVKSHQKNAQSCKQFPKKQEFNCERCGRDSTLENLKREISVSISGFCCHITYGFDLDNV